MEELEFRKKNSNELFLDRVCMFADLLLKEVLEQRSNPEHAFYLEGLPVTDGELLEALSFAPLQAQASLSLHKMWEDLMKDMQQDMVRKSAPRMVQLSWLYGLDEACRLAVMLAFACHSDPKYEKAVRMLQGDSGRDGLDVFLVQALGFYLGIKDKRSVLNLLMESRWKSDLFEQRADGQLYLQRYVFLWIHEKEDLKLSFQGIFRIYPRTDIEPVIRLRELKWCTALAERQIEEVSEEQLVFEFCGRVGAGKKYFCRNVAENMGYQLCSIHLSGLLECAEPKRRNLLNAVFFNCRVNSCIPYLDLTDCAAENPEAVQLAREIIEEYALLFAGVEPGNFILRKTDIRTQKLSLDKLGLEDSLRLWQSMARNYPMDEQVDYEQLAGKYRLLPGSMEEIFIRAERQRWENGSTVIDFPLLLSCTRECNHFLGNSLMERIETVFRWEDLKVEQKVIDGMKLACAHLKHRFTVQKTMGNRYPYGCGIGVLMYGPPGTGKTMAAQVIANDLQMDLYRVDLSQVTSKYVGETEKNLEHIFKTAEQSNVILFFDEADSLFGKRTEVKDSNDKYANQETSYILQRIESYEGMVILATNFAQNFDAAFMRRITISIHFSLPDEKMRSLLWKDMLKETELGEDTFTIDALAAQFELTGSNIKSIVRNAVFLALMEQHALGVEDIAKAIKIEFEKLGKIPNGSSFGMFYSYIC